MFWKAYDSCSSSYFTLLSNVKAPGFENAKQVWNSPGFLCGAVQANDIFTAMFVDVYSPWQADKWNKNTLMKQMGYTVWSTNNYLDFYGK